MIDYREILRLHSLKYSQRDIASSVRSSRNTVSEVISLANALGVFWPLADDVTNHALASLLYPERAAKDQKRMIPDYLAQPSGMPAQFGRKDGSISPYRRLLQAGIYKQVLPYSATQVPGHLPAVYVAP